MSERHHLSAPDPIPPAARPLQGLRAGVITRVIAGGVDYALVFALVFGCYIGVAVFRFLLDPRNAGKIPDVVAGHVLLIGFVFMVFYLWLAFATTGRTFGDRLMGLRVVGRKGTRLSWWSALLRALFYAVFPIGLLWCAVSRENRSVQDMVLRTSVIHHWPTPPRTADLMDVEARKAL
jgi:uncharacterized RDD family membrane protein YckC